MTQPRCLGHLLGRRRPPVNVVASLQSDLTNEFALCPAIAFPKRMSSIQIAEKIGRAIGKHRGIQVSEVVLHREFLQDLLQRRFEERSDSEEMAALGYVHRPKLSRPFVHVLEDVPMNRLKMRDVESPRHEGINQLRNAPVRAACFEARQLFWVSETAQVLEDVCAGIELRVRILGRRAHRLRSLLRLESIPH